MNNIRVAISSKFEPVRPSWQRRGTAGEYEAVQEFPGAGMERLQQALLADALPSPIPRADRLAGVVLACLIGIAGAVALLRW